MKIIYDELCRSQYLHRHPIKNEDLNFKIKYIQILQYFCYKYSSEDIFSNATINVYKETLLRENFFKYQYIEHEIKRNIKKIAACKQLYSHALILMVDCLFICAFDDMSKATYILEDLKKVFKEKHHMKMYILFDILYRNHPFDKRAKDVKQIIDFWKINQSFAYRSQKNTLLVTATMSAGKSTLVNALIGKNITQMKNQACTAKIHLIQNKAYEDMFTYRYAETLMLNADSFMLERNNLLSNIDEVFISTFFRSFSMELNQIQLIDTPGVNFSQDAEHKKLTEQAILDKGYYKLIYVINAEHIGTQDDTRHLEFIAENIKDKEIIFVLNKLDTIRIGEDNVSQSVKKLIKNLENIGFVNPNVCPISAYAALLAKKKIWGAFLNEDEEDDLKLCIRKFKSQEFDLLQYYKKEHQEYGDAIVRRYESGEISKYVSLLNKSGILALENIILK